ncbi:MAG: DMT family transporter [Chloroflexota bacterium]|nr:DMT family transporter [Chloroflexota bacterium]
MRRWQADLALVGVTLIWGSTFVVVKGALATVGPLEFVTARFAVAGLVLLAVWWWRRERATSGVWREGALTGSFLALGYLTQTVGLRTTAAGKAAFITGLSVVLVPLGAALWLRELPTWSTALGGALATTGLGLLTLDQGLRLATGDLWVLVCAFGFALHILATGHFAPRHAVLPFTVAQLVTVTLLSAAATWLFEGFSVVALQSSWRTIFYMGVVATALIFGTQTWGQRHTTSTHTALIFALEPVFAALFAALFAGEVITLREGVGGVLILLGMVSAEVRATWWGRPVSCEN